MISTALKRAEQLYDYMVENSIHETDVVTRQRAETETLPTPMHISQEQAQFFAFLIPAIGAKKALEVGNIYRNVVVGCGSGVAARRQAHLLRC